MPSCRKCQKETLVFRTSERPNTAGKIYARCENPVCNNFFWPKGNVGQYGACPECKVGQRNRYGRIGGPGGYFFACSEEECHYYESHEDSKGK
ncbi:hypothetical protein PGQ11_012524 [Apiospora arundinis]|uniref:Uncharacterized protein n=1 Tax=Apiospora arundinis TaxID=335852 RepID=A0ABR2I2I7_9PEZI